MTQTLPETAVPDDILGNWQTIINLMAEIVGVPAGLIMRVAEPDIEVFLSSATEGNPYRPGDREHLAGSGLYCETVLGIRNRLHVPNALADDDWKDNPDVKLNMISYLGLPLLYPDGRPFGTLCILDNKENHYSSQTESLMDRLRELIQSHLALLHMNQTLGDENRSLNEYLDELQVLRGFVPICSFCKKIRDEDDRWYPVERYLAKTPGSELTHSICPGCVEKHYNKS